MTRLGCDGMYDKNTDRLGIACGGLCGEQRGGVFENNLNEQAGLERGVAAMRYGGARAMRTGMRARACMLRVNFVSLSPGSQRPLAFSC